MLPDTLRFTKVPTEVMFGCAELVTLPAKLAKLLLPPVEITPVNRLPLPLKKLAIARLPRLALPDVILPDTLRFTNVPTLVIFG